MYKRQGHPLNSVKKRQQTSSPLPKNVCIFCTGAEGHLHEIYSLRADANIQQMAFDLQDTSLLATIGSFDLITCSCGKISFALFD